MSLARLRSIAAILLLLLAMAVVAQARPAQAAATFTNPVASAPYGADPWVGYYNGYYYLAATTWNNQIVIKRAASVAALPGATESVVYTGTATASCCNTPDYKIGMLTLTGTNPLSASSWTKKSTPIFQRSDADSVYGPGHHSFFTSPDGTETWMAYHANETTAQGCGATRTTRLKKITFNSDGTPGLGTPDKLSTVLTAPSGDPGGTASFPVAGTRYRLVSQSSGKVLDAANCGTANGTAVRQWTSLGNACQQWNITA